MAWSLAVVFAQGAEAGAVVREVMVRLARVVVRVAVSVVRAPALVVGPLVDLVVVALCGARRRRGNADNVIGIVVISFHPSNSNRYCYKSRVCVCGGGGVLTTPTKSSLLPP